LRQAIDAAPGDGGMDLLTVVMHELGHALGLGNLNDTELSDALMAEALGIQRLPEASIALDSVKQATPIISIDRTAAVFGAPGDSSSAASGSGTPGITATRGGSQPVRISELPRQADILDAVLFDFYANRTAREPLQGLLGRVKRGRS
jgi:hypothetical protein